MKTGTCHRCHAPVWTGPDDDVCALDATVDPTPLTITGECLAVINGRVTYAVDLSSKTARRIWRRHDHRIGKPDPLDATLHAAHICGAPVSTAWTAPPTPTRPTASTTGDPQW